MAHIPQYSNSVLILLISLVNVKSQLFFNGRCPTPIPLPNINITRYSGTWHLFETYKPSVQLFFSCQLGEYFLPMPDGTWNGVTNMTERLTGNVISVPGTVKFLSTDGSGLFTSDNYIYLRNLAGLRFNLPLYYNYSQQKLGVTVRIDYMVLATDYISYAAEWTCVDHGNVNFQFLWIFSRGRTVSSDNLQNVRVILNSQGINTDWLEDQDMSGCQFTV